MLIWSILQGRVKGANTISALEMPRLQRDKNSIIIDVNTNKDFELSHIPDSVSFPLEDINAGFDLMHAGESIRSVVVY